MRLLSRFRSGLPRLAVFICIAGVVRNLPAQTRLFAADSAGHAIGVIDLGLSKLSATVPVTPNPRALALSTAGTELYVSGADTNTMQVVDLKTLRVIRNVAVGAKPDCLAVSPDGRRAFLCAGGEIDVVDTAPMQKIRTIVIGGGAPHNIFITPDLTRMVVLQDGKLTVLNVRTEKAEFTIPVEGSPEALAFESDRHLVIVRLFVQMAGQKNLDVIDYQARKTTSKIALPAPAAGLAVTADRKALLVTAGDAVHLFSLPGLVKTATIGVDRGPSSIVCAADSKRCYAANTGGGTVSVIDVAAAKETAQIAAGKAPSALVFSAVGQSPVRQ